MPEAPAVAPLGHLQVLAGTRLRYPPQLKDPWYSRPPLQLQVVVCTLTTVKQVWPLLCQVLARTICAA